MLAVCGYLELHDFSNHNYYDLLKKKMAGRQIFAALGILRMLYCGGAAAAWQQLWKISSTAMLFFLAFTMVTKKRQLSVTH